MKYVIITPAKNEQEFIAKTIQSVLAQTFKPVQWLILNDGSSDRTAEIVAGYAEHNGWMTLVDAPETGVREIGGRIAALLNAGVQMARPGFDIILKLDADVSFDSQFCARMIETFERESKLGIASGSLVSEGKMETIHHRDHTRGATKFIRKQCWDDIGGVALTTGWDTVCDVAAQMKGWETRTLEHSFTHLKEEGIRKGRVKRHYWNGVYCGRVPYHPLYFVVRLISNIGSQPVFVSSLAEVCGYVHARFFERKKFFSEDVSKFYRKRQMDIIKTMLRMG